MATTLMEFSLDSIIFVLIVVCMLGICHLIDDYIKRKENEHKANNANKDIPYRRD